MPLVVEAIFLSLVPQMSAKRDSNRHLPSLIGGLGLCIVFLFVAESRDALRYLRSEQHAAQITNRTIQSASSQEGKSKADPAKQEERSEFWWNWAIQAATATATFLAVLAALFLDWFRAAFFPPILFLRMVEEDPPPAVATFIPMAQGQVFQTISRWYHVRLANLRRMTPAHDARAYIVAVELPNAAGQYELRTVGAIPLRVRHEGPTLGRSIGPSIEFDLLSVTREVVPGGVPTLSLHSALTASDLPMGYNQAVRLALRLQAQSTETDSGILRVEVTWDGQWSDDAGQMSNHLILNATEIDQQGSN